MKNTTLFKIGDKVINQHDSSYTGIVSKVKNITKGFTTTQFLWLNNSEHPVGQDSSHWSLLEKKPQVDFEIITFIIKRKIPFNEEISLYGIEQIELFFKLLAGNPSFAHKASKELKKLLK